MPRRVPKYYEVPVKDYVFDFTRDEKPEILALWFDNVPVEIRKKFESVELFFEGEVSLFLSFGDYDNYQLISDLRMVSLRDGLRGEVFWKDYTGRTPDLSKSAITVHGAHGNVNIYSISVYHLNFIMFFLHEMAKYLEYHKRKRN